MKRTLFLHIGMQRTATTSVQRFLHANVPALRRRGVLYPYGVERHNFQIHQVISGAQSVADLAADLSRRADGHDETIDKIVLSDEGLCRRPGLSALAGLCERFDVKVLYVLRRQDIWLESWYLQNVKWQWDPAVCHLTFDAFLDRRDAFGWIRHDARISELEAVFGAANILPTIYEASQMPDGPVAAFCARIRLEDLDGLTPIPHANSSLPPEVTEFMRRLPLDTAPPDVRSILEQACIDAAAETYPEQRTPLLLDPVRRREILADYAQGNRAVAQRYFGRDALFLDPLPPKDAPVADLSLPADSEVLMDRLVVPFVRRLAAAGGPLAAGQARRNMPRGADEEGTADGIVLQNVICPDPALGAGAPLYYHTEGTVTLYPDGPAWHLEPGARLSFDSYFNLFNLGKWRDLCGLQSLWLQLDGTGMVRLEVSHRRTDGHLETVLSQIVRLPDSPRVPLPLPDDADWPAAGTLWFTLTADATSAVLHSAAIGTDDCERRQPRLALSITTFRREAAVRSTAARIETFLKTSDFGDRMHLFVVDNGGTAKLPDSVRVSRIVNPNLGGAGGFARGLLEAGDRKFSHVLFMDDDASVHMEAIHRTYALLSLARDPALAVAGAMISKLQIWQMWENGAVFDGKCMPQFSRVDLRDPEAVTEMEIDSIGPAPEKFYGGWWFFAFPVAAVRHYPFPFFVRGDDVNFSLANPFRFATLGGVVSFAEDFLAKETPLIWYLDLRSHMVHHLALADMEKGRLGVAKIPVWFFLRNAIRFQYDTIEALLLAVEDVMRGPEFFAGQGDMADRRAAIKALTRTEAMRPLAELNLTERRRFKAATGWKRQVFRWTGNGHLLPFFRRWGNRVVVPPEERGGYGLTWGASRITYLGPARDAGYTVEQSKAKLMRTGLRLGWLLAKFLWRYGALRASYRRAYPGMTSAAYWRKALAQAAGPEA